MVCELKARPFQILTSILDRRCKLKLPKIRLGKKRKNLSNSPPPHKYLSAQQLIYIQTWLYHQPCNDTMVLNNGQTEFGDALSDTGDLNANIYPRGTINQDRHFFPTVCSVLDCEHEECFRESCLLNHQRSSRSEEYFRESSFGSPKKYNYCCINEV